MTKEELIKERDRLSHEDGLGKLYKEYRAAAFSRGWDARDAIAEKQIAELITNLQELRKALYSLLRVHCEETIALAETTINSTDDLLEKIK